MVSFSTKGLGKIIQSFCITLKAKCQLTFKVNRDCFNVNAVFQNQSVHCTEVRFASFLSGGFITAIIVNPLERKLAKRTAVHCAALFGKQQQQKKNIEAPYHSYFTEQKYI